MAYQSTLPAKLKVKHEPISWAVPILEGDDLSAYETLLAQISSGVGPRDVIEELWVRDIVDHTWELFRWRTLKTRLIAQAVHSKLQSVLTRIIHPDIHITDRYPDMENLVAKLAKRDRAAIKRVDKLLAKGGKTLQDVQAAAASEMWEHIERLDRFAALAESRRNAVLREIARHRESFAEKLREKVEVAEDAEFEVVAPGPEGRGGKVAA
jgi:hypothetical protein